MDPHERASRGVNKVLQTFFVLFIIIMIAIFAKQILDHTDGTVVTRDKDDFACQNSQAQDIMHKTGLGNTMKCK